MLRQPVVGQLAESARDVGHKAAAANLDFEKAASLRDQIRGLRTRELGLGPFPAGGR